MSQRVIMKTFAKWTTDEVEETFNLKMIHELSSLQDWLLVDSNLNPTDEKELIKLRDKLQKHVYDWNEEELKIKFIAPLLNRLDYDQEKYQSFLDRELSVNLEKGRLHGVVDFMIASGKRVPKLPVFCLHEYKKERYASNDPLGQLLISMFAVQLLNQDGQVVYGAYIQRRLWYFVVLDGSQYSVSLAYDATKDDLQKIWKILLKMKSIIEKRL